MGVGESLGMSAIFHYTDSNGLLGILSSNSLFATHYKYLNDLTEGAAIRDLILPIIEDEIAEITPKLVVKGWLDKLFYEVHGTSGHRFQAEKIYAAFVRAIDNVSPCFVTSFCRHNRDSQSYQHGLLSQWRAYGSMVGFALEFDEEQLTMLIKREHDAYAYAGLGFDNVVYDKYNGRFNPDNYNGIAREMIRQQFENAGIDASSITGTANIDAAALRFASSNPFFKHRSFSEEQEYRVAAVCFRAVKAAEGERRPGKPIHFRVKDGLIIPYIELFKMLEHPLPITSAIIGPHPYQDKQEEALKILIESKGLHIDIRRSGIPYRT